MVLGGLILVYTSLKPFIKKADLSVHILEAIH